jgi:SAM-dependent methyltransferase
MGAREGYDEWAATYEQVVCDEMDLRLLDRLGTVSWARLGRAVDLGCGTGRTGAWLKRQGVARIDGIDIAREMTRQADAKSVYDRLAVGDVLGTGFEAEAYELAVASLVDEHIRDLSRLYVEASRLVRPGGYFVIVGYHPQFIMTAGMPTHFHRASGEPVAIETHVHLFSDHFKAASACGFALTETEEGIIDDAWVAKKPKWARFRGIPISFAFAWHRSLKGETA